MSSLDTIPEINEFPCKVPDHYPTRLSLPYDISKLNSLHCFLRSELIEIFCVTKSKSNQKSPCHSPGSSVGRVGLRCVHCAIVRDSFRQQQDRDRAANNRPAMAVFYPKSLSEIYRLVTSWQRCHLRKCRNVPPPARAEEKQIIGSLQHSKSASWIVIQVEVEFVLHLILNQEPYLQRHY